MKKVTRFTIGSVVLLVLLALLTALAVNRKGLTAEGAEDELLRPVGNLEDAVVHDGHATAAVLAVVALFGFVMWTALRADAGEGKATPPARKSSGSGMTGLR
jgi:hypothetical protein